MQFFEGVIPIFYKIARFADMQRNDGIPMEYEEEDPIGTGLEYSERAEGEFIELYNTWFFHEDVDGQQPGREDFDPAAEQENSEDPEVVEPKSVDRNLALFLGEMVSTYSKSCI